ncbi:hypothetical protein DL95DRAFT_414510 [Leptodontidium sp. 2 PMI_412]|nr:hypothetical protein DL95DRAFT_414510 [Leptodontidium sp. 2 PMI_412]
MPIDVVSDPLLENFVGESLQSPMQHEYGVESEGGTRGPSQMDLPTREAFVAPYELIYDSLSTTESGINWAWEALNEIPSISSILPTKAELIAFSIMSRAARGIDVFCTFHRLFTTRLEEYSIMNTVKKEVNAQPSTTSPPRASAAYPIVIDLTTSFESPSPNNSTTTKGQQTARVISTRESKAADVVPGEPYESNTSDSDLLPRAKRRRKLTLSMPSSRSTPSLALPALSMPTSRLTMTTTSSSNLNIKVTRSSRSSRYSSTYEDEITTQGELNTTTYMASSLPAEPRYIYMPHLAACANSISRFRRKIIVLKHNLPRKHHKPARLMHGKMHR